MNKLNFNNKLANYDLYISAFASFSFGFILPVMTKYKGLLLTATMISIFLLCDKICGLLQPFILKLGIKLSSTLKITIFFDTLWSINLFALCIFNYDLIIFLYINFIINIFCQMCFVSVGFKADALISKLIDFEKFNTVKYTMSNLAMLISTGLVGILVYNFNEKIALFIGAILNLLYQVIAFKMIKEVKKYE